ncbi:MAG: hypothetical protein LC733_08900, partial [Actinobacteria bacterium]|nr:hypothetical protein [Actinomycetota bacterium]
FAVFAARSEAVLQQDVEGFISVIATEKPLADPNAEAHPNGPRRPRPDAMTRALARQYQPV